MKISIRPRVILIATPSILSSMLVAIVEKTTNAAIVGSRRFQVTYFRYLIMTPAADVNERSPERVTASPYEGIRKGSAVMMNMPNPNPIVLCMKLAPAARRVIYRIFTDILS